jgi:antitoxin ParD1/3/4
MNVSLTPELEEFVAKKVQSKRYTSASEVVREALRLLEEHERIRAAQLAEFQTELDRRLAALDRGEHVDPTRVRAELRSRSQRQHAGRR